MFLFDKWDDRVYGVEHVSSSDLRDVREELNTQIGQQASDVLVRQLFGGLHRRYLQSTPATSVPENISTVIMDEVQRFPEWWELRRLTSNNAMISGIATKQLGLRIARTLSQTPIDNGTCETAANSEQKAKRSDAMSAISQQMATMPALSEREQQQARAQADLQKRMANQARRRQQQAQEHIDRSMNYVKDAMRHQMRNDLATVASEVRELRRSFDAFTKMGLVDEGVEDKTIERRLQKMDEEPGGKLPGMGPGSPSRLDYGAVSRLSMDIHRSEALKEIVANTGRMMTTFSDIFKPAKVEGKPGERIGLTTGNKFDQLTPMASSWLGSSDPGLESLFNLRVAQRRLPIYQTRGLDNAGLGPIMLAIDESGSMGGTKMYWAMGVALAITSIAKQQHRDLLWVSFDSRARGTFFPGASISENDLANLATTVNGGGTNFMVWIDEIMSKVNAHRQLLKGDVIVITDGQGSVTTDYIQKWNEWRGQHQIRSYGIQLGSSEPTYELLRLTDSSVGLTRLSGEAADAALKDLFTAVKHHDADA